jgi:hypothetical protein
MKTFGSGIGLAFGLSAALLLAGCSDIDEALFGSSNEAPAQAQTSAPSGEAPTPAPSGETTNEAAAPGTLPGALPSAGTATSALAPTITPVTIESGPDTGTAVNKSVQSFRSDLQNLEQKLGANAQKLADLRGAGAQSAAAYHDAKAHIVTRLQIGTTRGNPELVSEWNVAQSALDQLTTNINGLNALGTDVAGDSSTAHYLLDQITSTFNVSGAVDEDHRQLNVLEDETNQTIVLIDTLLKAVSADVQRQTAYVANERANLTTLAGSIKNGELYGAELGVAPLASNMAATGSSLALGAAPLVVIRFDHPNVDYQQILYAALTQALETKPSAGFEVVAVSPTKGSAEAVQLAQTAAKRHAQEVLRSMTDMGVPATRLAVASATDPRASVSEVRVFVR